MKDYKVTTHPITKEKLISYEENGFLYSFTESSGNSDYQEYLASLEATEPEAD
jgi:hypothetical protein